MSGKYHWIDFNKDVRASMKEGEYAVLFSWDASEGSFTQSLYFDGTDFLENLPIYRVSCLPFPSEYDAQKWAENNDPCL